MSLLLRLTTKLCAFLLFASFFSLQAHTYEWFQQKPMVVIIPSYNNQAYYKKNLESVFCQKYQNYRVVYIDDCSTDQTYGLVQRYLIEHPTDVPVTVVRNGIRRGAMENLYNAICASKDYEVMVTLDGDDAFAHDQVLVRLNEAYQDPKVWLTYGQFQFWPSGQPGYCAEIPQEAIANGTIRKQCGLATHLRTFYAGLFKKIKKEDLLYNGKFYTVTWDKAMMAPMLEMAQGRWKFISDVLYIYNLVNPLSDATLHGQEQIRMRDHITQLPAYKPLETELPYVFDEAMRADFVLFSYDRPLQLYALLESTEKYVSGLGKIQVIYRVSSPEYEQAYQKVKERFACVTFTCQGANPRQDFKELTLQVVYGSPHQYVIFGVDDIIVKDFMDIREGITALEKHQAYGFYFRLGKNLSHCYPTNSSQKIPALIPVKQNIFAWKFANSEGDWHYPNSLDMVLYRKKDIEQLFRELSYTSPNTLEAEWARRDKLVIDRLGLCGDSTKIVNIPLNLVQHDWTNRAMNLYTPGQLLEFFNKNLKIAIDPLFRIKNSSAHIAYEPKFVERT